MKKNLCKTLISILFFLLPFITGYAQNLSDWFTVTSVGNKVWLIDDHKAANIYLIEGKDSALIVDTGMGAADLVSLIKKITDKPLIVVNTHGHPDHVGANYQFPKVYIHATDTLEARKFSEPEMRKMIGTAMLNGALPGEKERYQEPEMQTRYVPINEGYTFHLGGRNLQVMQTPGHTPGSICLLDKEHKYLFTGDNNNNLVWLFLEGCKPLSEYLATLQSQEKRFAEFDTLFPGHGGSIPSAFITDQVECVKTILNGTCNASDYNTFAGNGKICSFGKASVAYNPNNL